MGFFTKINNFAYNLLFFIGAISMTELIRGLYNILPIHKGGVVTIGNFDGVHCGHKNLINRVKKQALAMNIPSIVITFEPQPMEYFARNQPEKPKVARLTRFREKFYALAETEIDYILLLRFNKTLASLPAKDFVREILIEGLGIKHIIIGDDFRFGYHREGNLDYLKNAGEEFGFTVESMASVVIEGERASSTRVRKALAERNHALAERLLGRPYTMMGRIVHGNKLGRQLGFPTANIYLHRDLTPIHGIYVVRVYGLAKHGLPGVANVGIRPTIGGTRSLLEVHLFDFDRDIYGQHVTVEFCQKLRDEEYFPNLELLQEAIAKDVEQAKAYFKII